MSGLLDSLSAATNALSADTTGLNITGDNLANINTVGYTRRTLNLAETPSAGLDSTGTGVTVVNVTAQRDQFVEARIQSARPGLAQATAVSTALSGVETSLGTPGASLDATVSSLFDAFSSLSQDPTSTSNRDVVVSRAQAVAQGFAGMASSLSDAQQQADAAIKSAVNQVNGLSAQIATLNGQIATNGGSDVSALVDQRTVDANQLADLIGATVTTNNDGSVSLTAGNGQPLVIGAAAFTLTMGTAPTTGFTTIQSQGVDQTSQFTAGQIGGLLHVRDTLVPSYQGQLDQLAYDLATSVNAIHSTGVGANGSTNQDLFTQPATVAGAAQNMAVAPAVLANSDLVAASATGTAGDNQTASALAALRNQSLGPSGSSAADAWSQLVYQVGADAADANNSQTTQQQIVDQLGQMRDATSGVSSDEEAANLMMYQRAYEASARYFVTVNETLDALMAMLATT